MRLAVVGSWDARGESLHAGKLEYRVQRRRLEDVCTWGDVDQIGRGQRALNMGIMRDSCPGWVGARCVGPPFSGRGLQGGAVAGCCPGLEAARLQAGDWKTRRAAAQVGGLKLGAGDLVSGGQVRGAGGW